MPPFRGSGGAEEGGAAERGPHLPPSQSSGEGQSSRPCHAHAHAPHPQRSSHLLPALLLPTLTWTRYWVQKTSWASRRAGPGWSPSRGCSGWGPAPGPPPQVLLAAAPQGSGAGEAEEAELGPLGEALLPGTPLQG